jgi:hypothetical protein
MQTKNWLLLTGLFVTTAFTACKKDQGVARALSMTKKQYKEFRMHTGANGDTAVFINTDNSRDSMAILQNALPTNASWLGRKIDIDRPAGAPALVDSNDPIISPNNPDSLKFRLGSNFNKTFIGIDNSDSTEWAPTPDATYWINLPTHMPGIAGQSTDMNMVVGRINQNINAPAKKLN